MHSKWCKISVMMERVGCVHWQIKVKAQYVILVFGKSRGVSLCVTVALPRCLPHALLSSHSTALLCSTLLYPTLSYSSSLLGVTFAALEDDVDASVFHVTPEEIKTYIKVKDSDQLILKKSHQDNQGNIDSPPTLPITLLICLLIKLNEVHITVFIFISWAQMFPVACIL